MHLIIGILLFGAGCVVSIDHSAAYSCEVTEECPPGFECMSGSCLDPQGLPPTSPDAMQSSMIDGSTAAADAGVDAQVDAEPDAAPLEPDAAAGGPLLFRVSASADDAEELLTGLTIGAVSLGSSDLELVQETDGLQIVGLRFTNVLLEQGQSIAQARLKFTVDEVSIEAAELHLHAEAADDALPFTTDLNNISAREKTIASADWIPAPWPTVGASGADQVTPNIAALIQEVVNRPTWVSGGSIVLFIEGSGARVASSFNGNPAGAPELLIALPTL